jgi:hypothetical protein
MLFAISARVTWHWLTSVSERTALAAGSSFISTLPVTMTVSPPRFSANEAPFGARDGIVPEIPRWMTNKFSEHQAFVATGGKEQKCGNCPVRAGQHDSSIRDQSTYSTTLWPPRLRVCRNWALNLILYSVREAPSFALDSHYQ